MRMDIRIYYEDTDCGGVVYYANYLRYFERGRTEYLRVRGVSPSGLLEKGALFVVRKVEVDYLAPARYDDLLVLETEVSAISGASVTFAQTIKKEGVDTPVARGAVVLVMVNGNGKPARIPEDLRAALLIK
jgi:acyl-CoA thioester hydrolase